MANSIPVPRSTNRVRTSSLRGKHDAPCIVCGRMVTEKAKDARWVPVVDGGDLITDDPSAFDEAGDMGLQPIGTGCLRQHPDVRPYTYDGDANPVGALAKAQRRREEKNR